MFSYKRASPSGYQREKSDSQSTKFLILVTRHTLHALTISQARKVHAFICQSLTFCSATQPFIWCARFLHRCVQNMELHESSLVSKVTVLHICLVYYGLKRNALILYSSQQFCVLHSLRCYGENDLYLYRANLSCYLIRYDTIR